MQQLHRGEAGISRALNAIPIYVIVDWAFRRGGGGCCACRRVGLVKSGWLVQRQPESGCAACVSGALARSRGVPPPTPPTQQPLPTCMTATVLWQPSLSHPCPGRLLPQFEALARTFEEGPVDRRGRLLEHPHQNRPQRHARRGPPRAPLQHPAYEQAAARRFGRGDVSLDDFRQDGRQEAEAAHVG